MQLVMDRGSAFLVEGFAYSHLLEGVAEPRGYCPLPVPIDDDGIVPAGLRQVGAGAGKMALACMVSVESRSACSSLLTIARASHTRLVLIGILCRCA